MSTPRPEILRALRYVSENLERPLTVADVARAAHLSEFHLHRVFHATIGESVGRFITRRRLELAALRVAYEPEVPITRIALESGYSSLSNFSKAFTAYFGCSPSRVREPGGAPPRVGELTARYGASFSPADLYAFPDDLTSAAREREAERWQRGVRYETTTGRRFACLASPDGYVLTAQERTWAELIERARQLGICGDDVDAWGIAHDSPSVTAPDRCRYHACIPCDAARALPSPLFEGLMPEGRYAVFEYEGAVGGVADAYRSIYSCWFRESSVAPADYTPIDHYVGDHPVDGAISLEMWFRVRPRAAE